MLCNRFIIEGTLPECHEKLPEHGCQWVGMPGLGSRLSTYWPKKWPTKWSAHLWRENSYPLCPRRITWIKTKME